MRQKKSDCNGSATLNSGSSSTVGSFPRELSRTKPYNYSLFNLEGMATICQILSTPKENLWNTTLPDGRCVRKAFEFLYPFIVDKTKWPYRKDVQYFEFYPARQPGLLFAGMAFNQKEYIGLWKRLDPDPQHAEVRRSLCIRQPVLWVDEVK